MKLLNQLKEIEKTIETNHLALAMELMRQLWTEEASCNPRAYIKDEFVCNLLNWVTPILEVEELPLSTLTYEQVVDTFNETISYFIYCLEQEFFEETNVVLDQLETLAQLNSDHVLAEKEDELDVIVGRLEGPDMVTFPVAVVELFQEFKNSLPSTTNEAFNEQLAVIENQLHDLIPYTDYAHYLA